MFDFGDYPGKIVDCGNCGERHVEYLFGRCKKCHLDLLQQMRDEVSLAISLHEAGHRIAPERPE